MKLVTFQPLSVLYALHANKVYHAPENDKLNNKIFCLKVDENIMERIFMCAPSMPQVAIEFETEDYEEIDSIDWVNKIHLGLDTNSNSKYKEYTVSKIEQSSVTKVDTISTSSNPDKVQDDFINKHFKQYEKLSGKRWYRLADIPGFWSTKGAEELVQKLTFCMMPYREATIEDFNIAEETIHKYCLK